VERGLPYGTARGSLGEAHGVLVEQFEQGVTAYEELVGAAAEYAAEEGRTTLDGSALRHLTQATDVLRGIALGYAELRLDNRRTA